MMDKQIDVLTSGGKQAAEEDEFRYLSAPWLVELARGLTAGAKKYGVDNWRKIDAKEHVNRATRHLVKWNAGERKLEHIINASMRCMMAYEMAVAEEQKQLLDSAEFQRQIKRDEYLYKLGQATEEVVCKMLKGPKCKELCILSNYCSEQIEQLNTNAAEPF